MKTLSAFAVKLVLIGTAMVACCIFSHAQPTFRQNDPYLPGKKKFSVGILTTYRGPHLPAPALLGEVTYGVSGRTSLGLIGGTTGSLSVIGGKLATVITRQEKFRLLYRMTIIYYPERNGTYLFDTRNQFVMPWMLSMGLVDAEWRSKNGTRWAIGMGLLETHCIDGMMNLLMGTKPSPEEKEEDLPFEWFTTIQASVALPLSRKFTLRPEAITIWQGFAPVKGDDHKVLPLNLYLHLVYTF